jgi:hypothetical protein
MQTGPALSVVVVFVDPPRAITRKPRSSPMDNDVMSVFLRLDADVGRVVVRGVVTLVCGMWQVDLHGCNGETFSLEFPVDTPNPIGWLLGIMERESAAAE